MAEVITVAELQTWDEFPIQLVTSVCQLSTFNRCSNIVTTLSRQAPLYAFGTAAGEIAIMQVAPSNNISSNNNHHQNHQNDGNNSNSKSNSPHSSSSSTSPERNNSTFSSSSNQRSRTRARKDALSASAKVDRVGFFTLPQPSLPMMATQTMANISSSKLHHNHHPGSNPASASTFHTNNNNDQQQQNGVTSNPNLNNNNNVTSNPNFSLPSKLDAQQTLNNNNSGSSWAVTQLSYSPFSNTLFCLYGGVIYILQLVADDSQAVSTISGHTEQRFLRCVIVGQVPSPAAARGDKKHHQQQQQQHQDQQEENNNNNNGDPFQPQFQHHSSSSSVKNNCWLHFTIHSSLTEVKLAAFAHNQVSCFIVDTKSLTISQQKREQQQILLHQQNFENEETNNNNNHNNHLDLFSHHTPITSQNNFTASSHQDDYSSSSSPSFLTAAPTTTTNFLHHHNNSNILPSFGKVEINTVNTFTIRHNFLNSNNNSDGSSSSSPCPITGSASSSSSSFQHFICACWCGPLFICNSEQNYNCYAPEFSNPVRVIPATKETKVSGATSIFRERQTMIAMRCTGLYDSFHMDNRDDFSEEAPGVALLITEVADGGKSSADVALPFYAQIWMYESGGRNLVLQREIPCLFSMSSSVHLSSNGPWLLVVSADGGGIDVHNWQTGSHVQSCGEEFSNDFSITQNLSSLFNRSSAVVQSYGKQIMWKHKDTKAGIQDLLSKLYVEQSTEIVIGGAGKLLILQFESPRAALTQYAKATSIVEDQEAKTNEMMALQMFAISVGNRGNLFADDMTVGKTVHAIIPDGYDELLQTFAHVRGFNNQDSSSTSNQNHNNNNNNENGGKVCFNCKTSFGFLSKRHFVCNCCLRHFCERCAPIRDASDLIKRGVMRHGIRICDSCFLRLDENMFSLLLNGKFREALHYLVGSRTMEARNQYPEIFGELANISFTGHAVRLEEIREFHLPHIGTNQIDEILWRCIHSGKLALCAQLLPMACGTDEARWQHFVMYFLTDADAAMSLANNIPHHQLQTQIGKFVYSSILIALVKYSPIVLTQALGKWPVNFYSAALITSAIESSLKSKLEHAMSIQRECQVGGVPVVWESPWNWRSIGQLYIDDDVRTLVSAYLMLCKRKRMYIDALKMHLNFFEKYLPHHHVHQDQNSPDTNHQNEILDRERGGTIFEKMVLVRHSNNSNNNQHHHNQNHFSVSSARNHVTNNNNNHNNSQDLSINNHPSSARSNNNQNNTSHLTTPNSKIHSRTHSESQNQQHQQGFLTNRSSTHHSSSNPNTSRQNTGRNHHHHHNNNSSSSSMVLFQYSSSARQKTQKLSVSSKFSPLINTFEWILNYGLTDVLLRPGERVGSSSSSASSSSSHHHQIQHVHYDGPSLLPLILQVWRMDAVKYLLQWPDLTLLPDVIDSIVQQICEMFKIGKDGLVHNNNSNNSNSNSSSITSTSNNQKNNNNNNNTSSNNKNANLMSLVGSGGREYSTTNSKNTNNSNNQQQQDNSNNKNNNSNSPLLSTVGQENDGPMILQAFLHEITAKDVGATLKHHNLLACLYVHHAPHRLLDFLRESTVTSLDYAKLSQLVRQKRMFGELAYIMGRSGDASEAIRLVVRCLRDVEFAIQFVEDTDEQLWDELIKHVLQSPALIGNFLDHAIGHYDMAKFLSQIPANNRLKVPNATRRLGRVIIEQAIDTALNQTSLDSYNTENFNLLKDHYQKARGCVKIIPSYNFDFAEESTNNNNSAKTNSSNNNNILGQNFMKFLHSKTSSSRNNISDNNKKNLMKNNMNSNLNIDGGNLVCDGCGIHIDLTVDHVVFNVSGTALLHPSCAEPQCGTIPAVSFEATKLMMKEKQKKRAAKMEKDHSHLFASLEVYRDSEVYDICEVLPKHLRFECFSYLDYDSLDSCKEVCRSWYLHIRAMECGLNILLYNDIKSKRLRSRLEICEEEYDENDDYDEDENNDNDDDEDIDDADDDSANNNKKVIVSKKIKKISNKPKKITEEKFRRNQEQEYGLGGIDHRSVFQKYKWFHGSYPNRRPPFGGFEEGANGDEDENVFSSTFGLRIGGHGTNSERLNPARRTEELLVPVGNECFHSRN